MAPSQKRLTCILLTFTLAGFVPMVALWRDSLTYTLICRMDRVEIVSFASAISISTPSLRSSRAVKDGIHRFESPAMISASAPILRFPRIESDSITLPYILILPTFLATLLLIYLLLMNRLARREVMKGIPASGEPR